MCCKDSAHSRFFDQNSKTTASTVLRVKNIRAAMAIISHDVGDLLLHSPPCPYPLQFWWITGRQLCQQPAALPTRPWSRRQLHRETCLGTCAQALKASLRGDLFPVSAVPLTCAVPHTGPRDAESSSEVTRQKVSINHFPFCQLKLNLCAFPCVGKLRRRLGALPYSDSNSLIRAKDVNTEARISSSTNTLNTYAPIKQYKLYINKSCYIF